MVLLLRYWVAPQIPDAHGKLRRLVPNGVRRNVLAQHVWAIESLTFLRHWRSSQRAIRTILAMDSRPKLSVRVHFPVESCSNCDIIVMLRERAVKQKKYESGTIL